VTGVLAHAGKSTKFQIRLCCVVFGKTLHFLKIATNNQNKKQGKSATLDEWIRSLNIDDDYSVDSEPSKPDYPSYVAEYLQQQKMGELQEIRKEQIEALDFPFELQAQEVFHNPKDANREKFSRRKGNQRRNVKEANKRAFKIGKQKPAVAKIQPHSSEGEMSHDERNGQFDDASEDSSRLPQHLVDERNRLLHAAFETDAINVDPAQHEDLSEMLSMLSNVAGTIEDTQTEDWISYLENIVIMAWQVSKANSFLDVFVSVVGYIKMHTQKSVVKQILQLVDEITKVVPARDISPQAWSPVESLQNWDLFKSNTMFTKISFLLSAAMSLSVCSMKEISWSPLGLQLVHVEAAKQQIKAVDLIDAIVHTFTWMADVGYRVFQEKSLVPLLYADNAMRDFNTNCDYIIAHADSILAGNTGDLGDFDYQVNNLLTQVCQMKAAQPTGPTSLWLQNKYATLVAIKARIVARHKNASLRFFPIGMGITGSSGVGKSVLMDIIRKVGVEACGFKYDRNRVMVDDQHDKYDSTLTSDILCMCIDDIGNAKPQFTEKSPTSMIIKMFNNVAAHAVKAELNEKGVVFVDFKVGVMTSNFHDYGIRQYTDVPEACLRRFFHTRVKVKDEYRVPGSVSLNKYHPDLCGTSHSKDVWLLTIEECFVYDQGGKDTYKFVVMQVEVDGKMITCKDLDLHTYLTVWVQLCRVHSKAQRALLEAADRFSDEASCERCCISESLCRCPPLQAKQVEPHAWDSLGEVVIDASTAAVKRYVSGWLSPVGFVNSILCFRPVKKLATNQLANEISHIINDTATPLLVAITPEWMFQTSIFQRLVTTWQRSAAMYDVRRPMQVLGTLGIGVSAVGVYKRNPVLVAGAFGGSWLGSMFLWAQYRSRMRECRREYLNRRDALPEYAKKLRDSQVVKGAFLVSTLVVGVKIFSLWNKMRLSRVKTHSLDPQDIDKQESWFGTMIKRMGIKVQTSVSSKDTSVLHMTSAFKKNNLFWANIAREDGTSTRCNIFFPRKGVACLPYHVFFSQCNMEGTPLNNITVEVIRHQNESGGRFKFTASRVLCVPSDEHDMILCFVPNCPDLKTRIDWLPLTRPTGSAHCQFILRLRERLITDRVAVQFGPVAHKYRDFHGGSYNTEHAVKGACMGLLISESATPTIVGFHIGGNSESKYGVMQTVTQGEMISLIEQLKLKPGVLLSAEATDLPKQQFGRDILVSTNVHPHSMAARLTEKDYVDVLGSTKLRSEQRSTVEPSILSPLVAEHFGVENKWGPPRLRPNWIAYNATLEHIVNPADMFPPADVERARRDWLDPLIVKMKEYTRDKKLEPLTDMEAIMGKEGIRFIDPLPMTTSMGFPIFGPKSRYFDEVREGEILISRTPKPELQEELDRCMNCWLRGERAYCVTSATLKDEPTLVGSEKVRTFQAAPVALSVWIRKYFLEVSRFLSLHPIEAETAVGVNAFSGQWEELMNHAEKFAVDDQVIAWDYSKYDVRMNSQITTAVWLSFIELAEAGGVSKEHINVMKMMIADIVHPLMDYNGTLIMAFSLNTSGNNLTVHVNGSGGSIYVRLGFFHVYPHVENFRECVAALNYGDDFKGSVHPNFREFNFRRYKKFLERVGMKVTLPDKGTGDDEFMDKDEADFLKRHSFFIPEIGRKIGKLDEMSIFKSLHANLRSKETKIVVAVSCIETAMHEWFAHGRDVYTDRRNKMLRVCDALNLTVPAVNRTFDERVQHWHDTYKPT